MEYIALACVALTALIVSVCAIVALAASDYLWAIVGGSLGFLLALAGLRLCADMGEGTDGRL